MYGYCVGHTPREYHSTINVHMNEVKFGLKTRKVFWQDVDALCVHDWCVGCGRVTEGLLARYLVLVVYQEMRKQVSGPQNFA